MSACICMKQQAANWNNQYLHITSDGGGEETKIWILKNNNNICIHVCTNHVACAFVPLSMHTPPPKKKHIISTLLYIQPIMCVSQTGIKTHRRIMEYTTQKKKHLFFAYSQQFLSLSLCVSVGMNQMRDLETMSSSGQLCNLSSLSWTHYSNLKMKHKKHYSMC